MTDTTQPERLETRFLIFTTPDEGRHLTLVGEQLATSSDQAKRRFYPDGLPADTLAEVRVVAISENNCKLAKVETVIRFPKAGTPSLDDKPEDAAA